jgi:NAD(P)-dependent dehydrogenase (short-subunit alcohol dehydrogenase family)
MAILFAKEGADVAVNDVDQSRIDTVVAEVQQLGRKAVGVRFDVTDHGAVQAGAKRAREALGPLNVLCANAGIAPTVDFVDMAPEAFDRMIKVHLYGAFNCCKAVVSDMLDQGLGRIIITSSMSAINGDVHLSHYSAAKAGQIGFAKSLARELCSRGITVNVIAPGLTQTNILGEVDPEVIRKYTPPCGRIGQPEDQAWAAVYLASDEASFVTGHTLQVNGGSF